MQCASPPNRPELARGTRSARRVVAALLLGAAALASCAVAAQDYPVKAIRMVVGAPAGGTTDIVARIVAAKLGERLGQSVTVENRGGAGGNIGNDVVAKAAPDGYTLGMAYSGLSINPVVMGAAMPFDTLKDLEPVSLVATVPMFLVVGPATAATDVRSLVSEAKASPGKLAIAANSLASASHLAAELFKSRAEIDMTTVVYKGSAPALTDIMGGRVAAMFDTVPGAIGYVKSGQLRAIAVGGAKRLAILPDVPTLQESGLENIEIRSWYGVDRTRPHAGGHRPAPEPGDRRDHALRRHARAHGGADARAGRQHTGRIRHLHPQRDGRVGPGGQDGEDQAGMSPRPAAHARHEPLAMTIDVPTPQGLALRRRTDAVHDARHDALRAVRGRGPRSSRPGGPALRVREGAPGAADDGRRARLPGLVDGRSRSGIDYRKVVHGENALTIHRPLPPEAP